jgi:catechol 2,3-dioxygenase-like lactoylglutathione lyase family enzyme
MKSECSEDITPVAILVAMLPVSDLAVSASFYSRLLGLELRREFVVDGQVTGCSLSRADLPFALNLRRKSTLPSGTADLRGEHPIIWRVADHRMLKRFREHAASLGLDPTTRRHDDGELVRVIDPDGHDVLVGLPIRTWTDFQGYALSTHGYRPSHERPLLQLT